MLLNKEEKVMESYCDKCGKIVSFKTEEEKVVEDINGESISYLKKYDVCNECGNRFYSEDTYNHNVISSSNELRAKNGIITTKQIEEILEKYNIGKKPLSLVLGWGEITIIRYLDGQMPERVYSDILLKVLEDPKELLKYVERNKNLITTVAYKKVVGRIAEIRLEEDKSKIYLIAKHIIAKMEDITPLALQKILYYIQGFSLSLLNKEMFSDRCEAWVHGPVYREIYDRFSYYSFNSIDSSEFASYQDIDLDDDEKKLIDTVISNFGCYSGKTLEKMTHNSLPWITARGQLDREEISSKEISNKNIADYFNEVVVNYGINDIEDIEKYSQAMFKEVSKM
jgi:putative zinc finger/helix-turn-helix YgiT family protein